MQFQRESLPPNLTPSGQIAGEVMLQRGRHRVDKSVDVHRVDRLGPYGVAHDAQPDDLRRAQDARSLILSTPNFFSSGLKTGTVRLFSTMSTVFAMPVDATALAANGPPPARSHVVKST